jgi:hypothetical protein
MSMKFRRVSVSRADGLAATGQKVTHEPALPIFFNWFLAGATPAAA